MKKTIITLILIAAATPTVWAQDKIYRCGNEYTNNPVQAKDQGCKLVEGGNVTVVQGTRPASSAVPTPGGAAPAASLPNAPRVNSGDQKARDSDARAILASELRKAEARHAELVAEYNNGAPVRNALDLRNPQRYMERTEDLKASVARSESDLAGIKREIARLPAPAPAN